MYTFSTDNQGNSVKADLSLLSVLYSNVAITIHIKCLEMLNKCKEKKRVLIIMFENFLKKVTTTIPYGMKFTSF